MREKFWDLAGSKMGNLLKIKGPVKSVQASKEDDVDYKTDNQYATALKKSVAIS
jgi:hypothetical protein